MKKNIVNKIKQFDFILLFITISCVVFGIFAIKSATKTYAGGSSSFVLIQSLAAIVGFVAMTIVASIDYTKLSKISKLIYIFCVLFLMSVLVFGTGREDTGSKSWIRFGPIGIQPSEIVKIGYIITFSKAAASYGKDLNKPKNIIKLLLHTSVFLFLIMLQPDFGTTMVFIMIFAGILFAAKISWKYIVGTGVAIAATIPILWQFLAEYQKNRIRVLFNPESDPLKAGYHVIQSKIAIGSGGIVGKGIGQGTQTQLGYLPAKHTDFIYSVIGEEMGFIGCLTVAFLLFALVLRCIFIAKKSPDKIGSYMCVGVACMFLAHTFENIGMCIGLMPVTGIPLPFFSYGGSSIVTNLLAIGLVCSVSRQRNITHSELTN